MRFWAGHSIYTHPCGQESRPTGPLCSSAFSLLGPFLSGLFALLLCLGLLSWGKGHTSDTFSNNSAKTLISTFLVLIRTEEGSFFFFLMLSCLKKKKKRLYFCKPPFWAMEIWVTGVYVMGTSGSFFTPMDLPSEHPLSGTHTPY